MLIFKNALKKIKNQLGRFISLVFIVALGSAFFAGVRETSSDMIKTLDEYYDETNLMDFRIVSTMGLTDDDLNALKELDNSYIVEENYSYETVIDGDATKIYGLTENINNVTLIDGTMPQNNNECLVMEGSYNIGDTITNVHHPIERYGSVTFFCIPFSSIFSYDTLHKNQLCIMIYLLLYVSNFLISFLKSLSAFLYLLLPYGEVSTVLTCLAIASIR